MTLSRTQQQRDVAILQLFWALPTHPYDVERQLAALGHTWSTHGAVNLRLETVTSGWAGHERLGDTAESPCPTHLLDHWGGYGIFATGGRTTMTALAVDSDVSITDGNKCSLYADTTKPQVSAWGSVALSKVANVSTKVGNPLHDVSRTHLSRQTC